MGFAIIKLFHITQQANEEKFKQRKQWVVHGFSTRRRNPYATPRFR